MMRKALKLLFVNAALVSAGTSNVTKFEVSPALPTNASDPVLEAFVSYSIEFAFFPDYAGNSSEPNVFSNNLLNNLGNLTGTKPYLRVGGNTQDYAIFDKNLTVATNGTYTNVSTDYPRILTIGPSYYESFSTFPDTKFIYGFNLAANGTIGIENLLVEAPLACRALEGGRFAYWELGNEPDLYKTSAQGILRPANWNEQSYVDEWLNKTRTLKPVIQQACPNLPFEFYAPSFGGTGNSLDPIRTWADGLDADKDIALISSHNYIGGATQPGVTLQGTLMNHSSTVASIAKQLNESSLLSYTGLQFILGETNSLYNEGSPGLSNAFGAALWGIDFNLWCASTNIRRVHMHQGTSYRYQSWQPVPTNTTTKGTKPPYYGNIAIAASLGNITAANVTVVNIPLPSIYEAAYGVYVDERLARIAIVNMVEYNYTGNPTQRPSAEYSFSLPSGYENCVSVQRLMANGSDSISGITFDGYSYNYELDDGMPVLLSNVTRNESLQTWRGSVTVNVPYSSFVLLSLTPE